MVSRGKPRETILRRRSEKIKASFYFPSLLDAIKKSPSKSGLFFIYLEAISVYLVQHFEEASHGLAPSFSYRYLA